MKLTSDHQLSVVVAVKLGYVRGDRDGLSGWISTSGQWSPNCPDYAHDDRLALSLWETVPDNWTPRLSRVYIGGLLSEYKAGFSHNATHDDVVMIAKTAAEAICLAWLSWFRVAVEEASR